MKTGSVIALPCLCANLRRAARAVTQRYDAALGPLGLTITHFTILQALSLTGEVAQGRLGEILAMDSTTLTRTLTLMRRHGWVATRSGDDRRERRLSLSKTGKAIFNRALPRWQEAQDGLRAELGETRWQQLNMLANEVTAVERFRFTS
jgi:DNA-binding MarR family transcriptional regulator